MHDAKRNLFRLGGSQATPRILCRMPKLSAGVLALFLAGSVAEAAKPKPKLPPPSYSLIWNETEPSIKPVQVTKNFPLSRADLPGLVSLPQPPPIESFQVFPPGHNLTTGSYGMFAHRDRDEVEAVLTLSPSRQGTQGDMALGAISTYSVVAVAGPSAPENIVQVPIRYAAVGSVLTSPAVSSFDGMSLANAHAQVALEDGPTLSLNAPQGGGGPFLLNERTELSFEVGKPRSIQKSVIASIRSVALHKPITSHFLAFIDPTFEIDPSFPFAKDFELQYSEDAPRPVSAVPESSTLLLVGVVMTLGVCLRYLLPGRRFSPDAA